MPSKQCESCGMKMKHRDDFGGADERNKYCSFCCDEDGNLNDYDKVLSDMIDFVMQSSDFDEQKARDISVLHIKNQVAWRK